MSSGREMKEDCHGWAARDPSGLLSPYKFGRRVVGSDDVSLKITHCGVCYADVIWTRNKHGDSKYPVVPGDCEYCGMDMDVYCSKGALFTFNGIDADGTVTKGGYSSYIVVHERYCFRIPNDLPLALAAPLLCAGITVYSPMIRHKMNQPGKSLGVIGLGGLGHLAVKFGKAFGLSVTVFSTSISKKDEALNKLGADNFVISSDKEQMKEMTNSLNFIIDSASGDHPIDQYMPLLKTSGSFVLVGAPSEIKVNPISLIMGMKTICGSGTGGTKETQEMLDFCATQKIYPEIEMIPIEYINEALERMIKGDVRYRFVIDIENSLK
ncbi:putative cinnamyl alcohol dehydrogenase 1 [Camellia lanceoleosa]|uniref:Cinnamyl alcohol dehydrogenase 1 n=1 Tax=Camellia lanceoleosa TaxID=1840588 RepID=A0ACC0HL62_9ERIC|nr:putative cinnamyl alcohol dehydrogenase 1 [Camellia lanceoleosa]